MYTASDAFFEALWELGITYCFVNLGSDHPSLLEAIAHGRKKRPDRFPTIITCPNEMVALSMADGYARFTSKPQCVIVHVDVGTQGLGAAIHNASCGRAPVLIFAGLSPYTLEGELPGSRTEYIHWIQDVPDQKQIVGQYCRYTGEVKRGVNIMQMVGRAYQFAMSAPRGPVYLVASREALAEEINPYELDRHMWQGLGDAALPGDAVEMVAGALMNAEEPLLITGYAGRNHDFPHELAKLCNIVTGLRVLDTGGSDMDLAADHPAFLGLRYGVDDSINTADVILVADCDVPWIPEYSKPKLSARIFHIDCDPLKQQMPVFYLPTEGRWKVDVCTATQQLVHHIQSHSLARPQTANEKAAKAKHAYQQHLQHYQHLARPPSDGSINVHYLAASIRRAVPSDTIFAMEAVTQGTFISDQLRCTLPGTWLNCGGGGLGWSGGAALGIKLAAGSGRFVCQIVGDGTFLFSVPGSVYWIAQKYDLPVLTVVLNNKGWNAPRRSLQLVYPEGEGSRATNAELGISFVPQGPDYGGIAKAAAGGQLCAKKANTVKDFDAYLLECVDSVNNGVSAVLDAVLDAPSLAETDQEVKAQTAG